VELTLKTDLKMVPFRDCVPWGKSQGRNIGRLTHFKSPINPVHKTIQQSTNQFQSLLGLLKTF